MKSLVRGSKVGGVGLSQHDTALCIVTTSWRLCGKQGADGGERVTVTKLKV